MALSGGHGFVNPPIAEGDSEIGVVTISQFPYATRADTYTGTGSGTTVDRSTAPLQTFGIQVKGTGAAATAWDVRLEGSLDNANWTQILAHTNVDTDGVTKWTGTSSYPSLYVRSRCAGITLAPATNIVVTIVGLA